MGKKSTKENKNIYQLNRERLELTREKASELLESVTSDRIEKIESGKSLPPPDEVLAMSKCYQNPLLCNYFCSEECPIGRQYVPKVESKMLSQIVLEMLASLNSIDKKKNRLIEITADGEVSDDELKDFVAIQEELEQISLTVESLQLWAETMMIKGEINSDKIHKLRQEMRESRH